MQPFNRIHVVPAWQVPRGALCDLVVEASGQRAVTVGIDCHVRVWDIASGQLQSSIALDQAAGGAGASVIPVK
jgi:hypothetical protein